MGGRRAPFTQRHFRPELDCSIGHKGNRGHTWHVPIAWPDRDTYCSVCGKVRRKRKKSNEGGAT